MYKHCITIIQERICHSMSGSEAKGFVLDFVLQRLFVLACQRRRWKEVFLPLEKSRAME